MVRREDGGGAGSCFLRRHESGGAARRRNASPRKSVHPAGQVARARSWAYSADPSAGRGDRSGVRHPGVGKVLCAALGGDSPSSISADDARPGLRCRAIEPRHRGMAAGRPQDDPYRRVTGVGRFRSGEAAPHRRAVGWRAARLRRARRGLDSGRSGSAPNLGSARRAS